MALTDAQKLDFLWKQFQGRSETSTSKAFYEEATFVSPVVRSTQIWVDTIPTPAVTTTGSVAKFYPAQLLVEDITVSGKTAYLSGLSDWIPPSVDPSYQVRVYQNNGSGGVGPEVPPTDVSSWVFDYNSGILTFFGANSSHVKPYLIKGWRYIGTKGLPGPSTTVAKTFLTDDWTLESIGSLAPSRSFSINHTFEVTSLKVHVFEDLGLGLFRPAHVDWVAISSTQIKLLIADSDTSVFSGKVEISQN